MVVLPEIQPNVLHRLGLSKRSTSPAAEFFKRGVELFERGDLEQALAAFDSLLALHDDNADAHCARGVVLGRLERHEEALREFDRALQLGTETADVQFLRGVALAHLGRYDAELAAFDLALAHDPGLSYVHKSRAAVLAVLGRLDEALASIQEALRLEPKDEMAQVLRREILDGQLRRLVKRGAISWSGGKPNIPTDRPSLTSGPPMSEWILENRR